MYVLGLNGFDQARAFFHSRLDRGGVDRYRLLGHDSGAALVNAGRVVAAAEEERFVRVKKTSAFPLQAVRFCLRHAGIALQDVDVLAHGWSFGEEEIRSIFCEALARGMDIDAFRRLVQEYVALYHEVVSTARVAADMEYYLGAEIRPEALRPVPHHIAHLTAAFASSGFEQAAFLVSDGRGEFRSATMGVIGVDSIEVWPDYVVGITDSLGMLYSRVTRYLGFTPNEDEYKVMALAAYGDPSTFRPFFEEMAKLEDHGRYRIRHKQTLGKSLAASEELAEVFGGHGQRGTVQRDLDVAASLQETAERVLMHQLRYLRDRSGIGSVVLTGGVALNCKANGAVVVGSRELFDRVHVSPIASDVGVATGAGIFVSCYEGEARVPLAPIEDVFLGPAYTNEEIAGVLCAPEFRGRIHYERQESITPAVVRELRHGGVVGWFQGRMELGPRALGGRSILGDPRLADMKDRVNAKVKKRESFRPFAPAVLEDQAAKYFQLDGLGTSPYMTFALPVREEFRAKIPAVVHVDGTARVQTVSARQAPRFFELLQAFGEATGMPILLNTSFNVADEPIVCSPVDAVRCFLGTDLDLLAMEDFLVWKR